MSNFYQKFRKIYFRLISTNGYTGKVQLEQPLLTLGKVRIFFQGHVGIGINPSPHLHSTYAHIEARNAGSQITIGDGSWINNGFTAIAEHTSIFIGQECLIGHNVAIYDSDFHGIHPDERGVSKLEWAKAVCIGDNVFIGSNVSILKGVHIGKNSVIANGSIVTKNIPPNCIAGGNPARIIKEIPGYMTALDHGTTHETE